MISTPVQSDPWSDGYNAAPDAGNPFIGTLYLISAIKWRDGHTTAAEDRRWAPTPGRYEDDEVES